MECKSVRALADSYLSGQLLVETMHAVVHHLERCPTCRADFEARGRMRDTLRSAFERSAALQPRPEFLDELTARLRTESAAVRPARSRRWRMGIAAGVLIAIGVGGGAATWLAGAGLAELAHLAGGDHQNCALRFALAERPISLAEAARRFDPAFGRLESVVWPERSLEGQPIEFVERHSCVYQGQRFAHIVVRYKGTPVSLLVADEAGSLNRWWQGRSPREVSAGDGFRAAAFHGGGRSVFVVSTLPAADVLRVAEAVSAPIANALTGAES